MLNLFHKTGVALLTMLISLSSVGPSLMAWEDWCDPDCSNRTYVGGFGGGLYSDSSHGYQMGTAFFSEAIGGPLAVYAKGRLKSTSAGFGGVQLGYEWSACPLTIGCSNWSLAPAAEIEGYWYSHKRKGHFINFTDPVRLPEHDFYNSFSINSGVYLVNAVFSFNHSCYDKFSPYVGGGLGAARLSLNNAKSIQTDPPEEGVNHFNSRRNDSSWAFAAQVKAGLRYKICESLHIFGEYRYLFIDSSNYIFGSTVYPNHAPTSPWNVKIRDMTYNAFAFGFQYDL